MFRRMTRGGGEVSMFRRMTRGGGGIHVQAHDQGGGGGGIHVQAHDQGGGGACIHVQAHDQGGGGGGIHVEAHDQVTECSLTLCVGSREDVRLVDAKGEYGSLTIAIVAAAAAMSASASASASCRAAVWSCMVPPWIRQTAGHTAQAGGSTHWQHTAAAAAAVHLAAAGDSAG